jgi:hypothetical protein
MLAQSKRDKSKVVVEEEVFYYPKGLNEAVKPQENR